MFREPSGRLVVAVRSADELEQARIDLRDHRWAMAESRATEVLAIESLGPTQREGALEIKARSEREHRAQTVYEAMRAAEQSGRGEETLRLYQQLPSDSTLAAGAQEIFARAAPRVLSAATAHIESAQREGRCEEFRRATEQLALLLPACAIPNTVESLQADAPPPEFGRPAWVRTCAGAGAWVGGVTGGVVSVVLLPITWPLLAFRLK